MLVYRQAFEKQKKPPQQSKTLTIQHTDGPETIAKTIVDGKIGIGTGTRFII